MRGDLLKTRCWEECTTDTSIGEDCVDDMSLTGSQSDAEAIYKEVVIVGNGPSGICLSYMLAGNWPYYGDAVHPIDFLHHRLDSNHSQSLLEQDLQCLCEGLEGRSNNPVSVLFDTLVHVDADLGVEAPSFLRWIRQPPGHDIDHVVLGRALPGGCWQSMDQSALTISLSHWMELPNLSFKEFEQERLRTRNMNGGGEQSRALVADVAQYYCEYVQMQQLGKYFRDHTMVTSVERSRSSTENHWEVCGYSTWDQKSFRYLTPNVVLATGISDIPKRLIVPGEDMPFVLHSTSSLEHLVAERGLGLHSEPLMIIGAGLTAADAIISAHFFGIPIVHVFRRSIDDPSLIFRKLHENMYPEYHKVFQMMKGGGDEYRGYRSFAQHRVLEMLPGDKVRLEGPNASLVLKVSYALVLIGSRSNLSFLESPINGSGSLLGSNSQTTTMNIDFTKQNTIVVDAYTHESISEEGLFALGPLAGDNFVRFLQGGALAIANHLHRLKLTENTCTEETASLIWSASKSIRSPKIRTPSLHIPDNEDTVEGEIFEGPSSLSSSTMFEGRMSKRWRLKINGNQREQRKRRFSHPVCDL